MIVLWVTLLVLHQGYTLIPVTTVQLGEPVTFTCVLLESDLKRRVQWYKQGIGDNLKFIWAMKDSEKSELTPEFSDSRWRVNYNKNVCNLTILRTNQEDEGIYHCGITQWLVNTNWTGTYLLVKGNTQRTLNYTVVEKKTVSPAGSVTLQCSVLSDSDNRTCQDGLKVFWFTEGTQTSHPNIIYTDGNTSECEKRSHTKQRCHFSKSISSSDKGTYHCAVVTCGQILFGNGTKQQMESSEFTALVITITCLAVSVIFNIIFICCRTPRASCEQFKENNSSQARQDELSHAVDDSNDLNYVALHFSGRNTTRGKKKTQTDESVYSQVKCRM